MAKTETMTLLKLLKKYTVVIPKIQRDYAQGRTDDKTNGIREKLLNDMKAAIVDNKPIDLNFVYGKLDSDNKVFIPIDGQQRLTTLFLLHLYAFRNDKSKDEVLKNFTYDTRISSRDFLSFIVLNRDKFFGRKEKPSAIITDNSEFVSSYNYDPTVQSTLVMLDEIAAVFKKDKKVRRKVLAAALEGDNCPITFKFLNINDLGSGDDLYIKLNARGKPLTDFENFKAKFLGRLEGLNGLTSFNADEFELCFDGKWTDIFWKRKGVNYEQEYRTFFEILLYNYGQIEQGGANWVQTLKYEEIPPDLFTSAYNLLNYLADPNSKFAELIFKILEKKDPTAKDYVTFHYISVFLLKRNDLADDPAMTDWLRVFRNIVANSDADIDQYDKVKQPVDAINKFASDPNRVSNILEHIDTLTGFDRKHLKDQLEEEKIKAKIIYDERQKGGAVGGDFEKAINTAEAFAFFKGQIRAALYLSKDPSTDEYDLVTFTKYWGAIEQIFASDAEGSLKHGILLRRALLSIGDYTEVTGEDKNYRTLRSDDDDEHGRHSLKLLFSNLEDTAEKLLKKVDGKNDAKTELEKIITTNLPNINQTDWRYCLIQYKELFDLWAKGGFYRIEPSPKALLVVNRKLSGRNYELFTEALKLELKERKLSGNFINEDKEVEKIFKIDNFGKNANGNYFLPYKVPTTNGQEKYYKIEYNNDHFEIFHYDYDKVTYTQIWSSSKATDPNAITATAEYIQNTL